MDDNNLETEIRFPETLTSRKFTIAIEEMLREVARQHSKWGAADHQPPYWVTILTEEVGEVARATLESNGADYRKELIHVAAVCLDAVRCYEDQMARR